MPLETILVVDQDYHSQLLAFSLITNKSSQSFEVCFKDYMELGGKPFRIIVVNRLQAQLDALFEVFPDTYVMFCLVHIRRDLLLYFDSDDMIVKGFDMVKNEPFLSFSYLEYLKTRSENMNPNQDGKKCLDLLIKYHEHWLPILLIIHGMYLNFDSSRIEGLFGLLKANYGHDRGKISTTIKNLNNLCNVLKTQSYASYNHTFKHYENFPLIPEGHLSHFGAMILKFLETEFNAMLCLNSDQPCVWCALRECQSPLTLPCRHTLSLGFVIDINQIHPRFLRDDKEFPSLPNTVLKENIEIEQAKTRSNFLARIDPFVSLYGRNKQVDNILDTALSELENLQVRPNQGMPPTLAQAGHAFQFPSHNVYAGRQPTKRKY